ncbi:MAG: hypothetical protein PHC62_01350 [Candidatus Izemoplasmatales bacterium]|jgi:hypothetical protein|nr:hypothetical protein [Candidatus Izemoplasmatales bacterium]
MRKWILVFLGAITTFGMISCNQAIPDYSIDEAFVLMNQAIVSYLEADSLSLEYTGNYVSTNYNNDEVMTVKMKKMNSDNLIGQVSMTITENNSSFDSKVNFIDGIVYTANYISGNNPEYLKKTLDSAEYQRLYQSFLKAEIKQDSTRSSQIEVDKDNLTIQFELKSEDVEPTFFVSSVLQTVRFAIVKIVVSHQGVLRSLSVEYEGTIDGVVGVQTYSLFVLKLNQYVIIKQLSSTEKAIYQESTDETA